jgi:hypothetical protein
MSGFTWAMVASCRRTYLMRLWFRQALDRGQLEETGRRSYYRLFPEFSELAGLEPIPLEGELSAFTLPAVSW